jgi:hypothetical protein
MVADALGQPDTADWRDSLADDARRAAVRRATLAAVDGALSSAPGAVAVGAPAWRPLSGTDVDLLAVDVVDVARRLESAGFLPVPAHDEPERRVLLRCAGGRAVDLVDVEVVEAADLAGAGSRLQLTSEAAIRRFRARLAARPRPRLVDLADAEELGVDSTLDGPLPVTAAETAPRRVRVLLSGGGAPAEADRLADGLRMAALDVVLARALAEVPQAVGRHLRDRAVLLAVGLPLSWAPGSIRADVPSGGLPDGAALALLRRVLAAF